MFYRTHHFRNRYGNADDITNLKFYQQEPTVDKYYNLKAIDYQFEEDKITMTIQFFDGQIDTEVIYDKDIKQMHDGGIVAVIYSIKNFNHGNEIKLKFIERYKLSQGTRSDPTNYSQYEVNQFRILQVIVPSSQDSLLNMDYAVNAPSYVEITSNMEIITVDQALNLRLRLPKLNFIGEIPKTCSKNDLVELKFNVMWHDKLYTTPITVYPLARQGYVNKNKVITKDGIGSFKFVPLYLDPEDIAEINIGYKHRTNVLSTNILITE